MARSIKDRLFERLPGTRTATGETRPKLQEGVGLPQKITGFYREFKTEMKKVTWPGRKETISSTAVVIVTVLVPPTAIVSGVKSLVTVGAAIAVTGSTPVGGEGSGGGASRVRFSTR